MNLKKFLKFPKTTFPSRKVARKRPLSYPSGLLPWPSDLCVDTFTMPLCIDTKSRFYDF